MTLVLGIDLGTTKTTCIAVDTADGRIVANATAATSGSVTSEADRSLGRSEFDARKLIDCAIECLKNIAEKLGSQAREVIGLGITGQQHGMVVVDRDLTPLTPFINWQDQRGNEPSSTAGQTWVEVANQRIASEVAHRTGCRLRTGFMATSLFWLAAHNRLPPSGTACFLMDVFAATLTKSSPVTDPSCAGSAGVFDVPTRQWNHVAIQSLGLSLDRFPTVREAHETVGRLTGELATATGLPTGMPVFVPIGDHQASFLGSVADRHSSVLLNVGTGAQVAVFTPNDDYRFPIELRPFPIAGNLLSCVGLTGGWQFQVVEQFFRKVGEQVFGQTVTEPLYAALTKLAESVPSGAAELNFVPTFSGTRANPTQRGSLTGLSAQNLTPGHFVRSLIEGMATDYRSAYDLILSVTGQPMSQLVTAGNGLRENRLLADIVAAKFGLQPQATRHREEAAFGAALIATVGAGVCRDLNEAGRLVAYDQTLQK